MLLFRYTQTFPTVISFQIQLIPFAYMLFGFSLAVSPSPSHSSCYSSPLSDAQVHLSILQMLALQTGQKQARDA